MRTWNCWECGRELPRRHALCRDHPVAEQIRMTDALWWALDYVRRGIPEQWDAAYWPGVTPADVALARRMHERWEAHRSLEEVEQESKRPDSMVLWRERHVYD